VRRGSLVACGWVACVLSMGPDSVSAQDRSGSNLADRLKAQDVVTVMLEDGRTQEGTVEAVSSSDITLMVDSTPRVLDLASVREIRKRGDSLRNGTVIGLVAGLGGSIALGGYAGALCDNEGGQNCPRIVVAGWVVPLAMGMLLGAAFDADHVGTTLVFGDRKRLSIAPVVGHRTYGAAVHLTIR